MSVNKRWLLGIDDSLASYYAFQFVLEAIQRNEQSGFKDELTIVHVYAPSLPFIAKSILPSETTLEIEAQARREYERILAPYWTLSRTLAEKVKVTLMLASGGTAADVIVRLAKFLNANNIVVGVHVHGYLKSLVSAHTARMILDAADTTVTIVKVRDQMSEENFKQVIAKNELAMVTSETSTKIEAGNATEITATILQYQYSDTPMEANKTEALRKCGEGVIKKVGEKVVLAGEQMKNVGVEIQQRGVEMQQKGSTGITTETQPKVGIERQEKLGTETQQKHYGAGVDWQQQKKFSTDV
jgi:nucleotide-binding universal stress UspA family protein